jgi:hypothetical protein
MATMSDGNPVSDPCPVPCPDTCPVDVSSTFSTREIEEAVTAYRATINSYREKLHENGDKNKITEAEETMRKSLTNLSEVCQKYNFTIVAPVVEMEKVVDCRPLWVRAFNDLQAAIVSTDLPDNSTKAAIVSTDLPDNSTKAAMIPYFMTRSAIGSIENAIETLSTIETVNAIEAVNAFKANQELLKLAMIS